MKNGWEESYELGKKAFAEKKYASAMRHLEKVVAQRPAFADVFNMLGLIYYYNARRDEALSSFKKALEINPAYTEASLNLAVVYNEIGDFDRAREAYAGARETKKDAYSYLDPYVKGKLANMHAEMGTIYRDLGLYREAAEEYKKALKLRPEFADIKTYLGVAYRGMRDYANAVRELEEAVRLNEAYLASRIQLGLTYYTMGEQARAKAEWEKVLAKNPDDKMAKMYMSLVMTPSG